VLFEKKQCLENVSVVIQNKRRKSSKMAESNIESDGDKRKQFGNRLLTDSKNVFEHNAW
jgi:hypothetical protein